MDFTTPLPVPVHMLKDENSLTVADQQIYPKESIIHHKSVKRECVDSAHNSFETCLSKQEPENHNGTIGKQTKFTSVVPVIYQCACGKSFTDPLLLREHGKDHRPPEQQPCRSVERRPVRPVRRKKRKAEHLPVSVDMKIAMRDLLMVGASRDDISQVLNIPVAKVKKYKKTRSETCEEVADYIARYVKENRFWRMAHIRRELKKEFKEEIDDCAIKRVVNKNGYTPTAYYLRKPRTDDVVAERLDWARKYRRWTNEEWTKVLWTGQAAFRIYAHPDPESGQGKLVNRRLAYQMEGEDPTDRAIRASKTGKGGVRIWACLSSNGVGKVCRIEGSLDPVQYLRILQDYMLPSAWALIGPDFILQHDSDCSADDTSVQRWLSNPVPAKSIEVMVIPTHSVEIFNPLENLFNNLCFSLDGFESDDPDELWMKIEENLLATPVSTCKRLNDTMRERCYVVREKKGNQCINSQWN